MQMYFCNFLYIIIKHFIIISLRLRLDGNLYAGAAVDFMSTDPGIFRTMGSRPAVRSEQYDSKWLNGK